MITLARVLIHIFLVHFLYVIFCYCQFYLYQQCNVQGTHCIVLKNPLKLSQVRSVFVVPKMSLKVLSQTVYKYIFSK